LQGHYAKKAYEHRGFWSSPGWGKKSILENALKDFDTKHAENEKSGVLVDKLEFVVDTFLKGLATPIK
jgi:hypothetical protein